MKKINLFLMAPLASLMFACSDYVGELDDQHDEYVELREEIANWTSGCKCNISHLVTLDEGVCGQDGPCYDYYSKVESIEWGIEGCDVESFDFSVEETSSTFGTTVFEFDSKNIPVIRTELSSVAMKGLMAGSHSPLVRVFDIGSGKNDVLSCETVYFAVNPDSDDPYGSDEKSSSSTKDDNPKSSSSGKAESSSSSEKVTSSSSAIVKPDLPCGDLWCGTDATGSAGGVNTGFDNGTETSGLWYWYDDNAAPNNGDSKITFPDVKEEDKYGNFFGPLADKYGGITGSVTLGNNYEYPFVGLGFNLVSENQEGADITEWDGVCLTYSSTANFQVELTPEDENVVTEYNNYKATVAKSSGLKTINLTWDKFKQEAGWGKTIDRSQVLKSIASVKLKFSSISGSSGDFFIYSIGRRGTCDGSRRDPASSSGNGCGDLWCGATDVEGRVEIPGQNGDYSGYWLYFDDQITPQNGNSRIIFPADVKESIYGNFFGPLTEAYKGIKGYASIGNAYEYPYAGIVFNTVSEKQEGADITDWGGMCLTYYSTAPFKIELGPEDEASVTEYNNYTANVGKTSSVQIIDLPWSKFKQATGWGKTVAQATVLKKISAVKIKFSTSSGDFAIFSVGRYGTCKGTFDAPSKSLESIEKTGKPWIQSSSSVSSSSSSSITSSSSEKAPITGCECTAEKPSVYVGEENGKWTISGCTSTKTLYYAWTGVNNISNIDWAYNTFNEVGVAQPSVVITNEDDTEVSLTCPAVEAVERAPITGCECTAEKPSVYVGEENGKWTISGCTSTKTLYYAWTGVNNISNIDWAYNTFNEVGVAQPSVVITNEDDTEVSLTCPAVEAVERGPITDCECKAFIPSVRYGNSNYWTVENCRANNTIDTYTWTGVSADPELPSKGVSGPFGADMSLTPTVRVTDVRGNFVDVVCETATTLASGNLWNGASDVYVVTDNARVPWYTYDDNDAPNNGNTEISITSAFNKEYEDNFAPTDPRIEYTVTLGNAYEYPFAGIGFNLTEKGDTGVDITSWQGICLTYKSTAAFAIEMIPEDESRLTQYNNYKANVAKTSSVTVINLPWAKFKQESGWGKTVAQATFLEQVAQINLKHSTISGTTTIYQVGRYGSCSTAVIE